MSTPAGGNPNIRVEITDERTFHCFRLTFNAKASPENPDSERGGIEIMLHATDLIDLIHKASLALSEWQANQSAYLLNQIRKAAEAGL